MTLHSVKMGIYSLLLTNYFGLKLKKVTTQEEKKALRFEYSETLLKKLKIAIEVKNQERLIDGQYLILSNHRGIIDPLILEIALKQSNLWSLGL